MQPGEQMATLPAPAPALWSASVTEGAYAPGAPLPICAHLLKFSFQESERESPGPGKRRR